MELVNASLVLWTLVVATIFLAVIALYRQFTKLKRCGIHGPTPVPIFGNFLQVKSMGFGESHGLWFKKYDKLYGYYMGYRPEVSVSDPDMLKTILVKEFTSFIDRAQFGNLPKLMKNGLFFMEGRQWKRTRNLLTPTFSAGKLKHMLDIINKCAETLAESLQNQPGETSDLKKSFGQFTMDTIAATAFGIEINSQKQPDEPFVKNISKVFNFGPGRFTSIWGMIMAIFPAIGRLIYLLGVSVWNKEAVDFYERTGRALIEDRMKSKSDRVDFLNLMINAEFDESKEHHIHYRDAIPKDKEGAKELEDRLSLDEMNGTAFVFFLAGYETTATLLYFAAYCLAVHSDTDTQIVEEINSVLGSDEPTYEGIGRLTYMEQFLQEVLRLYPPVPRFNRLAAKDVHIGDVVIPKGTVVNIPVWFIHRSEEFYTDPETFDPSRFASGNKGLTNSMTFLPFGTGPRHCIGLRLAMVEAKLALVNILRKVKFVRTDKTQVPLDMGPPFGTMRPKEPIVLAVQRR